MSNIIFLKANEFKGVMRPQTEQMQKQIIRDLNEMEQKAQDQRLWLRELACNIREISYRDDETTFHNYDLMFMKRSFRTCWSLYRDIMQDKKELKEATKQLRMKQAA